MVVLPWRSCCARNCTWCRECISSRTIGALDGLRNGGVENTWHPLVCCPLSVSALQLAIEFINRNAVRAARSCECASCFIARCRHGTSAALRGRDDTCCSSIRRVAGFTGNIIASSRTRVRGVIGSFRECTRTISHAVAGCACASGRNGSCAQIWGPALTGQLVFARHLVRRI